MKNVITGLTRFCPTALSFTQIFSVTKDMWAERKKYISINLKFKGNFVNGMGTWSECRADFRFARSQWETSLQSNSISRHLSFTRCKPRISPSVHKWVITDQVNHAVSQPVIWWENQWMTPSVIHPVPHQSTRHSSDSRLAPSQWEMPLQRNPVSHWLGANLVSALRPSVIQEPDYLPYLTNAFRWKIWMHTHNWKDNHSTWQFSYFTGEIALQNK